MGGQKSMTYLAGRFYVDMSVRVVIFFISRICILCARRLTSFFGSCSDWEQPRAQLFFWRHKVSRRNTTCCRVPRWKYESWTPAWSLCWRVPIKWKFNIIKGQYDIKTETYSILDWLVRTASWWFGLKSLSCFALEWFEPNHHSAILTSQSRITYVSVIVSTWHHQEP